MASVAGCCVVTPPHTPKPNLEFSTHETPVRGLQHFIGKAGFMAGGAEKTNLGLLGFFWGLFLSWRGKQAPPLMSEQREKL